LNPVKSRYRSIVNFTRNLAKVQDMTEGSIVQKLVMFCVPLLIGNIVQQLYNTVDLIVVGQYIGDDALAAVGLSTNVFFMLLIIFVGVSTGAGILVSQFFGAKDRSNLSHTVGTTITLMIVTSVMIMIVGTVITRPLLRLLDTPVEIIDLAADYLFIILIGIAGPVFYNGIGGILRGMGDSLVPLLFLIITCLLNVILDLVFVAVFHWGVAGAAWATVIAQAVSGILCFIRLAVMKDVLDFNKSLLVPKKSLCLDIARLGLPAAATQLLFSFANMVVQRLINSFGTEMIASTIVVMRVDGFAMMPNFTFGIAMATFVGQNIGAKRYDRVRHGVKTGAIMGIAVSAVLVAIMLLFGKPIIGVFTETDSLINLSYTMIKILAVGYIAMSVIQTLSGAMRGKGDTVTPMWISFFTTVVLRMPLAYLLAYLTRSPEYPVGRPEVIYISLLTAWIFGASITLLAYRRDMRKSTRYDDPAPVEFDSNKTSDAILPESEQSKAGAEKNAAEPEYKADCEYTSEIRLVENEA
jgi:putative MATE family efflux protein